MGGMKDMLGDVAYASLYPVEPGWKEGGTSRRAARAIGNSARGLRADVLAAIGGAPDGLTADEVAEKLGARSVLAIRPRVTELGKQGKIVRSGRTRPNESGQQAVVWIARAQS